MCLIAGGISEGRSELIRKMILAGRHRGRDGFGVWAGGKIFRSRSWEKLSEIPQGDPFLVHCRLAITGSSEALQPFSSGKVVLTHNGEVYNHEHIRSYFRHFEFESDSDSEVLLPIVEMKPDKAFQMVLGDYAVAFSDGSYVGLLRDIAGIRPLYYSPNGFFASEKKVLWTIGEKALTLPPGSFARLGNFVEVRKILSIHDLGGKTFDPETALESLYHSLSFSVRAVSKFKGKLGVLFSGGLDSTLIASLLPRKATLYVAGRRGSYDVERAKKVASELGMELETAEITLERLKSDIQHIAWAVEDPNPITLSVAVPMYYATKRASEEGLKVLLSGSGADELFGGYAKYLRDPHLMEHDLNEMAEKNLVRDDKVGMLNGIEVRFPYLLLPVLLSAMRTPLEMKVNKGERKIILHKLGKLISLPEIALKGKKAAQYGSGATELLRKLARKSGLSLRSYSRLLFTKLFGRFSG